MTRHGGRGGLHGRCWHGQAAVRVAGGVTDGPSRGSCPAMTDVIARRRSLLSAPAKARSALMQDRLQKYGVQAYSGSGRSPVSDPKGR